MVCFFHSFFTSSVTWIWDGEGTLEEKNLNYQCASLRQAFKCWLSCEVLGFSLEAPWGLVP